jgi:glycosyltransferase involved in cell wall biosynthesis
MTKISATVITLNEEEYIRGCLESLSWCDEIIVVDSYSEDDTVKIAEEYTNKIFQREEEGYSEPYRKFAAEKASGEWIVQIDADERISHGLRDKLKELSKSDFVGVKAPRKNFRFGKWIKGGYKWPDYTFCMYKTEAVSFSEEIHNFLDFPDTAQIKTLELKEENSIIHYSYLGVSDHIERMNRYTDIEARQKKESSSWLRTIFKPIYTFWRNFAYKGAYKDGFEGFMVCSMDALASLFYNLKLLEESKIGGSKVYSKKYKELDEEEGFK